MRVIGAVDMPAGGVWTAYIKQDLSASQLVAAVPVTGSLVCICWFNPRNTTETVSFLEGGNLVTLTGSIGLDFECGCKRLPEIAAWTRTPRW